MDSKVLCIVILIIAKLALHTSAGASTFQVKWSAGANYEGWFSTDFIVGDILAFKFDAGKYNVIEVDERSYTDCTVPSNPKKVLTSGDDSINLDHAGDKYFICGTENGKYCKNDKMKMHISVPKPYKSAGPKEYIVGDDKGWAVGVDYNAWLQGKDIMIGDTLVFKYPPGTQNVYTVHQDLFKDCIIPTPDLPKTTGEDRITMPGQGQLGFISSVDDNCKKGVKLLVTIGCPLKKKVQGGRKLVTD